MIQIIGEKLNSSIPKTLALMRAGDYDALAALIAGQKRAGAAYMDINTALCGEAGLDIMRRLIDLCREARVGVMLDSPDPAVIAAALPETVGMDVIVNSVTCDARMDELLPLIAERGGGVVLLPIRNVKIPHTAAERLENAVAAVEKLQSGGVAAKDIYVDALVESIATAPGAGAVTAETIRLLRGALPDCHILCGLSNVSFGLPARSAVNATAVALFAASGLDTAICDPLSPAVQTALHATAALLGEDDTCMDFIEFIRNARESANET